MILFHIRIRVNSLFKDFPGYQRDKNEKRKRKKSSLLFPHTNQHSASSYSRRQGVSKWLLC